MVLDMMGRLRGVRSSVTAMITCSAPGSDKGAEFRAGPSSSRISARQSLKDPRVAWLRQRQCRSATAGSRFNPGGNHLSGFDSHHRSQRVG